MSATAEALKQAGLDFEVFQLPMVAVNETEGYEVETSLMANCRMIESSPYILGHVGKNYRVLQNQEAFKVFDPFFENDLAKIESAGAFGNGRKVYIQAKVNRDGLDVLPGDTVEMYLLLANSHDGSLAVHYGFTPQRVSCQNTLMLAVRSKKSQLLSFRHRGDVILNLEEATKMIDLVNQQFITTVEHYQTMAQKVINQEQFRQYVKAVFSAKAADEELERESKLAQTLDEILETQPGADIPGVRGTVWNAYNAATYYLKFVRGNNLGTDQPARLDNLWFGQAKKLAQKSLTEALELAKV